MKIAFTYALIFTAPGGLASASAQSGAQSGFPQFTDPGSVRARESEGRRAAQAAAQQFEASRRLQIYSPAERDRVRRQAQRLMSQTDKSCDVTTAVKVGRTDDRRDLFEVACASGMGYVVVSGARVTTYDCQQLAEAARIVRTSNANADVGTQCTLPENGG